MRAALVAFCFIVCASAALAQTQSEKKQPGDSEHSTGRTVLPDDNKGQLQPQGWTCERSFSALKGAWES